MSAAWGHALQGNRETQAEACGYNGGRVKKIRLFALDIVFR
jgi:hypothetical protein